MKIGILSDVHANLVALETVLAAIGTVDALWVCGDTVGYGPEPSDVLALLVERKATIVAGNHDRAVATGEDLDLFNPPAAIAAKTHQRWLSVAERDMLAALPRTLETSDVTLCHGSLRDPLWERRTHPCAVALSRRRAGAARPREVRDPLSARPARLPEPRERGPATRRRSPCRVRDPGPCGGHRDLPSFDLRGRRNAAPNPGPRSSADPRGSSRLRSVSFCFWPRSRAAERVP